MARAAGGAGTIAGCARCCHHPSFREGVRAGVAASRSPAFVLAISFGVLAEPVMGAVAPIVMSAIVFAGSAQFGALAVLAAGGGAARGGRRRASCSTPATCRWGSPSRPRSSSGPVTPRADRPGDDRLLVGGGGAARAAGFDWRFMLGATDARLPVRGSGGTAIGVLAGDADRRSRGARPRRDLPRLLPRPAARRARSSTGKRGPSSRPCSAAAIALALIPMGAARACPVIAACLGALIGLAGGPGSAGEAADERRLDHDRPARDLQRATIRASGPLAVGGRRARAAGRARDRRCSPRALLAALIVVETVGGEDGLDLDAAHRPGVAAAGLVLTWRRYAMLAAIAVRRPAGSPAGIRGAVGLTAAEPRARRRPTSGRGSASC